MNVKFLNLKKQYLSLKKEVDASILKVVDSQKFIQGEEVAKFEGSFSRYNATKHAIGLSSGTSALYLALLALNVQGGEAITVPNTFIATTEAITAAGAKVKFVDVDPETHLMDTKKLEEAITPKTKAIVPVHFYGLQADMKAIKEIAEKHDLKIIEDAAQAHGSKSEGKSPGFYGDVACFSFYPGKNLGAYGDAGACITNDENVADIIQQLRDHGRKKGEKYTHSREGHNHRMDEIQAAVLNVKLKHLDRWVEARRAHGRLYHQKLKETVGLQKCNVENHAYHLFVIKTKNRDALKEHLKNKGIETGIHYPVPLHLQNAYKYLALKEGSFPVTEQNAKEILSLPMDAELKKEEISYVIENTLEFLQ